MTTNRQTKLFLLLIVVVGSASFAVLAFADKDDEPYKQYGEYGYFKCFNVEENITYYYDQSVFSYCEELKEIK